MQHTITSKLNIVHVDERMKLEDTAILEKIHFTSTDKK